jgi:uncharacterized protein (DUF849 family)
MNDAWVPLILTVAPTGAYKTRQDHHALPITPAELADTAARCLDAGAAMIHLHVRDADGRHSLDPGAYQDAINAVRAAVGERLVIQITSEAGKRYVPEQQMAAVRAVKPEAVSLAVRELAPDAQSESHAAAFFHWLEKEHVVPQYILFSEQDVARYQDLANRDVIPGTPHWLLFVLGKYSKEPDSTPQALLPYIACHDNTVPWAVCAFGHLEHACGVCAACLGGHVRVGFENNVLLPDRSVAADNAALITHMRNTVSALGRPLTDADTLREMFEPK